MYISIIKRINIFQFLYQCAPNWHNTEIFYSFLLQQVNNQR